VELKPGGGWEAEASDRAVHAGRRVAWASGFCTCLPLAPRGHEKGMPAITSSH